MECRSGGRCCALNRENNASVKRCIYDGQPHNVRCMLCVLCGAAAFQQLSGEQDRANLSGCSRWHLILQIEAQTQLKLPSAGVPLNGN